MSADDLSPDDRKTAETVEQRTEAFAREWNQRPGVRRVIEGADRLVATPAAVEALAEALFEAAGDYECTWEEARTSIGQGIFCDVARAILSGRVPGLYTQAQIDTAVAAERERCEERFEGVYRIAAEIACEGTDDYPGTEQIVILAGRCITYLTLGEVRAAITAIREGKDG